jgi:hypothetical protein
VTEASYKAGLRALLDGSREALEHAIEDAVEDGADAAPIVEQLREIITAERALADEKLRQIEMPDEAFTETVRRAREALGR